MKVLVTGGAGFIGSHTVDLLLARGHEVRVMDSLQQRVHPRGKPDYVPAEVEFVHGDVTVRPDLERALTGVEAVMHLAAYQDYQPDFSRFVHTNTESMASIFELVVGDPQRYPMRRIVHASSQAVSGEGKYSCDCTGERTYFHPGPRPLEQLERGDWEIHCPRCGRPARDELIDEDTCVHAHTTYGISKYAAELLAANLGTRYGIETAGMRYTYVQGPRNSIFNPYSGIARRFALQVRAGIRPTCYEDARQRRDYVNVYDAARANVAVLEAPGVHGLAFNVGGGRAVTVEEFAWMMIRAHGSDLEPEVTGQFRVGDTRHTVSDISRIRSLGWEPSYNTEQSIEQFLAWVDTQPDATANLREAEQAMRAQGVVRNARAT